MSNRSVQLRDPSNNLSVGIDQVSNGLVTIDSVHVHIHDGIVFSVGTSVVDLADDGLLEVLVQTPASGRLHVRADVSMVGDSRISFFTGTTVSANGNALSAVNRNQNSSKVTGASFFEGPTITDDGSVLVDFFTNGGQKKDAVGADIGTFGEWILDASTNYLFRTKNLSTAPGIATMSFVFYDTAAGEAP